MNNAMCTLKNYLLALLCITILTSCATTQTAPQAPQNQVVGWEARAKTLSSITRWNISGMIAIRNPKDNVSASIHWKQTHKNYALDLFGPMGTNAFKLTGSPHQVSLQNPHGQMFYASSPEQLLVQQTGWNLPVSNLYYWIRGLPVPGVPAQKHLDAYNHITQLDQEGWQIQYLRYTSTNSIDLPTKIFMRSNGLSVKLIISQWQVN
ncbi:MAG: lipoprotein insertase outer membrane protein LolB [Pseudomonadota bacterium]